MTLVLQPPEKRLTIVSHIGTKGDGDSLAGLNVNDFPAGALVFVKESNRFYRLKKNLDVLVIPDVEQFRNVVDGVGSSAAAGRWIAVSQLGYGTLVGGTINIDGFDLSTPGFFQVCLVTPSGSPGFVHAAAASVARVTITSASNTDTSTYSVVFWEDTRSF